MWSLMGRRSRPFALGLESQLISGHSSYHLPAPQGPRSHLAYLAFNVPCPPYDHCHPVHEAVTRHSGRGRPTFCHHPSPPSPPRQAGQGYREVCIRHLRGLLRTGPSCSHLCLGCWPHPIALSPTQSGSRPHAHSGTEVAIPWGSPMGCGLKQ